MKKALFLCLFLTGCQSNEPNFLGTYQTNNENSQQTLFILKNGVVEQEIKNKNASSYKKGIYLVEKDKNILSTHIKETKEVYQIEDDKLILLKTQTPFIKK